MATVQKKTVLITGCSTGGIGWAMAKSFHQRGYYVFATARDPSKAADLAELDDIEILELDVTVPKTIAHCKEVVSKRTGGRLDVLVNNAGVEFNSPLLDTDIAEAKRLYDVNVWGPLAMIQAFAPLLIEAKGVVFNQSSIDAALNMVWAGIFASSKSAVARMSETLRVELEPLGVRVVTSMAGSADTPMFAKPGGPMKLPETSYYHGVQDEAWKERMDHQRQAMKVDVLAEKLVKEIVGGSRGVVWHGAFAPFVHWAGLLNITSLMDKMINSSRGVSQVKRS
jgi:1-acylglycerone phosphate reductase